jgi:hypothetical protein
MTTEQQDCLPKVDVHMAHMPGELVNWNKCDISNQPIVLHHIDGIPGNILQTRIDGFSLGTHKYVSFWDPDDTIEPGAFQQCIDFLELYPKYGGCYTNSTIIRDGKHPTAMYKQHKWSLEYHSKSPLPVHQLVVVRREVIQQATHNLPPISDSQLCEQLIYAHCAVIAPFYFLDINGYNWFDHPQGDHKNANFEKARHQVGLHIRNLLGNL